MVWQQNAVTWLIDNVVYRNLTYAPWRPMSIRQILRTNKGINAVGPQYADSKVYIRRIRYTPLSDKAVADAFNCVSMFACYGALPPAPVGSASTFVSLSSTPSPTAGRRHLLANAPAASSAALADAVSTVLPGMPASNVSVAPSAYGLSMRLILNNLDPPSLGVDALDVYTDLGLETPLVAGIVDDVIPPAGNTLVQDVSKDPTGTIVYVSLLVSGYESYADVLTDYTTFSTQGAVALSNTAASLNDAVGLATTPYVTTAESAPPSATAAYTGAPQANNTVTTAQLLDDPTKCPSYPARFDAGICVDAAGNLPVGNPNPANDWCSACVLLGVDSLAIVTTFGVTVPIAATAKDAVEAALANSMSTGALGAAVAASSRRRRSLLQAAGVSVGNVSAPSQLDLQRICAVNVDAAASAAAACAATQTLEKEWRAVGITFVICFGVLVVVVIAFAAFAAGRRAGIRSARASNSKMSTKEEAS